MGQVRRLGRPTDVPDTGIICDLLWTDPDKDITGWAENNRGVSFMPHRVVEDGYEFLAKQLLITVFSAPDHYGEFDNAGVTMTTDGDIDELHGDPSPAAVGGKAHYDSYLR